MLEVKNLTLAKLGILQLKKISNVTGNFIGDTSGKYGEIYVYDNLRIGIASGETTLKIEKHETY